MEKQKTYPLYEMKFSWDCPEKGFCVLDMGTAVKLFGKNLISAN